MDQHVSPGRALIVGDCQRGILRNFGDDPNLLANLRTALAVARAAGDLVVFVTVAFRAGHPEIHPRNAMWAPVAANGLMLEGSDDVAPHPDLGRRPDEPLVVKHRVGAFAGTDLEQILRSRGITEIVLCGVATSGVVLSTVCAGADLDYSVVVLSDATKDADTEVHAVLTGKVFPRRGRVITTSEWATALGAAPVGVSA